jgi:antitoxin component YwqK of YwqJK toxin-antitoxin module
MKNKLLLLLAALSLSAINAQQITDNDKLIYLDSLNQPTTNLEQVYFRVIKGFNSDAPEYKVYDYYKSGKIKNELTVSDKISLKRIGKYTAYYENGNKSTEYSYDDKSVAFGLFFTWYENGKLRSEGEYLPYDVKKVVLEQPQKINQYWNPEQIQKVINGSGYYKDINNGTISTGKITNGLKDSIWTGRNKNRKFTFNERYDNGKFISGTSVDSTKVEHKYTEIMVRPEPKGGLNGFYKYIGNNFRTPEVEGLNGKIFATFVVNTDGTIGDIKIVRDIGHGTAEEARRVLTNYKDFNPGLIRGILTRVQYSIPITIQSAD